MGGKIQTHTLLHLLTPPHLAVFTAARVYAVKNGDLHRMAMDKKSREGSEPTRDYPRNPSSCSGVGCLQLEMNLGIGVTHT